MLITTQRLISQAQKEKFILPAFNTYNLEFSQAIVRAAVAKKSPVIIQASENAVAYIGLETMVAMTKALSDENREVPISLHLDHGRHYKTATRAAKAGFSSVMFDGADLPFEKNVQMTRKVAEYAHEFGIFCQGELGSVPEVQTAVPGKASQPDGIAYTDPDQAQLFVNLTGLDTLAVAVGNIHGYSTVPDKIDFDRLAAIQQKVSVPLVIHGGSGITAEDLQKMRVYGVAIVNINTDLYRAFTLAIRKLLAEDERVVDPRDIFAVGRAAAQAVAQEKIDLFGSANKATASF